MKKRLLHEDRFVHLDMVRGCAALLVCVDHLRHADFVDYWSLDPKPGALDKLFYLLTTQGHNAVMIFFVLSGFFIAGSVVTEHGNKTWSWARFAVRRLSRLYVVLVPALVLTLLWDYGTQRLAPGAHVGDHGLGALGANLLFVQSIFGPVYGSNFPLWSIAYEFWYYVMFPLLFTALLSRGWKAGRFVCLLLFVGCMVLLPSIVLMGGVIWLIGYGAFVLSHHPAWSRVGSHIAVFGIGATGLLISVYRGLSSHGLLPGGDGVFITFHDCLTAFFFSLTIPWLVKNQPKAGWYRAGAVGLSDISYTLYAVHIPVVMFLFGALFRGREAVPSLEGYGFFAACLGGILLYATGVWWLFESRTATVRRFFERMLLPAKAKRADQE